MAGGLVLLLGKHGLIAAALLALPWFAWRYDNDTGAFLPLAILFLLILGVLALLLALIAVVHAA